MSYWEDLLKNKKKAPISNDFGAFVHPGGQLSNQFIEDLKKLIHLQTLLNTK